jgi:pimeloyl-ACP methyl ester carboxylesterase/predicted glycosyltransferase
MKAMRAREPDGQGYVDRDGVKIFYESFGDGPVTVLLLPTWPIADSRYWKAQVPYLARHFRVVAFDPRGNGRSDRPLDPMAYADREYEGDALAVLDAVGVDRAVLAGLCTGGRHALTTAARHPDRVLGVIALAPSAPWLPAHPDRRVYGFDDPLDTDEGWAKYNLHYWKRDFQGFAEFFFSTVISEPHSTKQIEDAVGWAMQTTPEVMTAVQLAPGFGDDAEAAEEMLRSVRCPVLLVHGSEDRCQPEARGARVAELTNAQEVVVEGAGHLAQAREPVIVNRVMHEFLTSLAPRPDKPAPRRWTRPLDRPKRVLYLSSPIGLGHAERDVAIVDALRRQRPGLRVDWLAQHPVTEVLTRRGETIHPASRFLASEVDHVESEAGEHDLHAFQAVRRMDEILVANFMLFTEIVEETPYDLWVGDEAWELDYFLHENPELKRAPYAWLTDFVGWLPMPSGGAHEAALTADYNAEMVEQVARWPRLRDRAVFIGNPGDVVDDPLGPGLPTVRDWTEKHFAFAGYVGADAAVDRDAARAALGWAADEKVCVATVGGSGVGGDLLRRVVDAFPAARARVPGLRMVVVAGPRLDAARLPAHEGLEVHGYVHGLNTMLAGCDVAVSHGGLTTTMTLTAHRRPFLYVPLRNHFEQNRHVAHRLDRYGAGRWLHWSQTGPDELAAAIAAEVGRAVDYRPVETDGADRAAALLAELI